MRASARRPSARSSSRSDLRVVAHVDREGAAAKQHAVDALARGCARAALARISPCERARARAPRGTRPRCGLDTSTGALGPARADADQRRSAGRPGWRAEHVLERHGHEQSRAPSCTRCALRPRNHRRPSPSSGRRRPCGARRAVARPRIFAAAVGRAARRRSVLARHDRAAHAHLARLAGRRPRAPRPRRDRLVGDRGSRELDARRRAADAVAVRRRRCARGAPSELAPRERCHRQRLGRAVGRVHVAVAGRARCGSASTSAARPARRRSSGAAGVGRRTPRARAPGRDALPDGRRAEACSQPRARDRARRSRPDRSAPGARSPSSGSTLVDPERRVEQREEREARQVDLARAEGVERAQGVAPAPRTCRACRPRPSAARCCREVNRIAALVGGGGARRARTGCARSRGAARARSRAPETRGRPARRTRTLANARGDVSARSRCAQRDADEGARPRRARRRRRGSRGPSRDRSAPAPRRARRARRRSRPSPVRGARRGTRVLAAPQAAAASARAIASAARSSSAKRRAPSSRRRRGRGGEQRRALGSSARARSQRQLATSVDAAARPPRPRRLQDPLGAAALTAAGGARGSRAIHAMTSSRASSST